MAGAREIVEVLHFVGASDSFIVRHFQRYFFRLSAQGTGVGGAAAILLFLASEAVAARNASLARRRGDDGAGRLVPSAAGGICGYIGRLRAAGADGGAVLAPRRLGASAGAVMMDPRLFALRSLLFNVAFYVNIFVLMILGLPALLIGRHGAFFMARTWAYASIWLLEKICGLRLEFRGLENIPQGGYILGVQAPVVPGDLLAGDEDAGLRHHPQEAAEVHSAVRALHHRRRRHRDRPQQRPQRAGADRRPGGAGAARRAAGLHLPRGHAAGAGRGARLQARRRLPLRGDGRAVPAGRVNTGVFWGRRGFLRRPGVAVIEFLPVIPPGLGREAFFARLQNDIETATNRLIAEARAARPALDPRPPPPKPPRASRPDDRRLRAEESPGSKRTRRRITSGGGDPRESATESKPPSSLASVAGKGERVR